MTARFVRRLGADEQAVTAVEFGLLAVPLCLLLFVFLDLGYQIYVRAVLQGALNDAARTASVENPDFGTSVGTVEQRVQGAIKSQVGTLVKNGKYEIETSSYYRFSQVGRPERLITDKNSNGQYDPGDCWQDTNPNDTFDMSAGQQGLGGADDIVFYNVLLTAPRLFPLVSMLGAPENYSIRARAAIRTQPYAQQRQPEIVC